jgi:predicted dehydrogenase
MERACLGDHRVLVVGAGRISPHWIPTLMRQPDVEIVGVVDAAPDDAAARLAELGLDCRVFATLQQALRGGGANLVVNLTPVDAHRGVIEEAFAAGCDVLSEKPLAPTLGEALWLAELSRTHERTLGVMQNRRNTVHAQRIRAELAAGMLGPVSSLSAELTMSLTPTAAVASKPHPLLQEMTIHTFDMARSFSSEEPVEVFAHEFSPPGSPYAGPPAAVCVFALSGGGAFTFHGNWAAPGHATSFNGRWRIAGARGTVCWDSRSAPVCEFEGDRLAFGAPPEPRREVWRATTEDDEMGHEWSIGEFLDALSAGRRPHMDAEENVKSLAMVAAALRSADLRRWVTVEEVVRDAEAGQGVACA